MSLVRLVASDEQRRPQAGGGDVDCGADLSYNGGGFVLSIDTLRWTRHSEGPQTSKSSQKQRGSGDEGCE
jgi:hypothetical protein